MEDNVEIEMKIKKHFPAASAQEKAIRTEMMALLKSSPIPESELCENLPLYIRRQTLMDVLALNEAYKRILTVPGVIIEAGTRWGRKLATLISLRGVYEPYNINRRIIGFDTFEGFLEIGAEDGDAPAVHRGAFTASLGYREYLQKVLTVQEQESPLSHVQRFEIYEGDIAETLPQFLNSNPEVLIALVYLDLDLYKPTRAVLEAISPRLVRGTVLAFDQVGHPEFPGETRALNDVLGLRQYRAELIPGHPHPTIFTIA